MLAFRNTTSDEDETRVRSFDGGLFDRVMQPVGIAPPIDVSQPLRIAPVDPPNVFETPRIASDPPPPWVQVADMPIMYLPKPAPARAGARHAFGWAAVLVGAVLGAATMLAVLHPPARAALIDLAADLAQAVARRV